LLDIKHGKVEIGAEVLLAIVRKFRGSLERLLTGKAGLPSLLIQGARHLYWRIVFSTCSKIQVVSKYLFQELDFGSCTRKIVLIVLELLEASPLFFLASDASVSPVRVAGRKA